MALDYASKNGHTTVTLTPAEYKRWADLAQPIHDEWLKKNAAKGGKEIYDTAKKMIGEFKGK
jgi:TRAP-type C4-dicarboxylate transport system substrate-binding protein